ncbi:MAG: tetratricopeptide repeat protein [Bernardetiaceae bacterium]
MSKTNPKPEEKEQFYENPEVIEEKIDQAEAFVTTNKNILLGVLIGIAALVAGYFFYQTYNKERNAEAERELFSAIFFFEKDSLTQALNGDGNTTIGLLAVSNDFSGTKAANLAKFYAGAAQLKLGQYDAAIASLEGFDGAEYLLEARKQALIGDAYNDKGDAGQAIKYYTKAASKHPNTEFTPIYLQKLAIVQEQSGDMAGALASYERIIKEFPKSDLVNRSKREVARLRQLNK